MAGKTFLEAVKHDRENRKGPGVYASDKVFGLVDEIDSQRRRIGDLLEANNRYQQEARNARALLETTVNERDCARHSAAVGSIGHDQLNRFIRAFDALGFRGHHIDKQVELACDAIRSARARAEAAEPDYFGGLVDKARTAAAKASFKFPQPNYVTLKIAEEAGEVVRGAVHYAEGRMDWSEVEGEIVQLLAMLIRFVTEGDQVNGVHLPGSTRDLIEGGLLSGDEQCECGETTVEECDDCCDLMVGHRGAKTLPEDRSNG